MEGINKQREIGRETEWTSVKISKNLYERGNFSRIPTNSQKEVASQIGSLSEIEYRKIRFDTKLRQMLEEALSKQGQKFCTIVSKHLHDRVVFSWQTNRMPMACSAMWKLWEEQGSHKDRIIYTTPSGQSSTITIVFATGLTKEDHAEKLPLKYTQEIDSKLQQILREARNKKEKFRKITPQRWHNRDVATLMPLACKVMWQLWEEQGSHEERIIDTTPRSLSPTISVEFDTGLMEKNKKQIPTKPSIPVLPTTISPDQKIWETQMLNWKFWQEATVDNVVKSIASFADINARDEEENTPLHWVARLNRKPDLIALLLDRGADINACDMNGDTPLHWVAGYDGKLEVIALLLDRGANINARGKNQDTPLHWAVGYNRKLEVIALLLDRGAKINARDKNQDTPLHWVARFNWKPEVFTLLRDRGADVTIRNDEGKVPFDYIKDGVTIQSTVPSTKDFTRPVLQWASRQPEDFSCQEVADAMADYFALSAEARKEQTIGDIIRLHSNANWAISHLKHAELLRQTDDGNYEITDAGRKEAFSSNEMMTISYLMDKFPVYRIGRE